MADVDDLLSQSFDGLDRWNDYMSRRERSMMRYLRWATDQWIDGMENYMRFRYETRIISVAAIAVAAKQIRSMVKG